MRSLWTVLSREVAERRLLLVGSFVLGACPFLYGLLPDVQGLRTDLPLIRLEVSILLALVAMAVIAVILGSTVIARDLAERRLGFYFSRPIPGWSLWAGKLLAVVLLTAAAGSLIALPAALAAGPAAIEAPVPWPAVGLLGVALVLAHAWSVSLRARSPWLLLDLTALVALPLLTLAVTRQLRQLGYDPAVGLGVAACAGFVVALIAGALQLTRGRTDLRRGHRILSLVLWGGLFTVAAGYAGFSRWIVSTEPADLREVYTSGAPSGPWIALSGKAPGRGDYQPAFLMDVDSGRFLLLPVGTLPADPAPGPIQISGDGRRAAWFAAMKPWYGPATALSLVTADLSAARPRPVFSPIAFERAPAAFALSSDGELVATLASGRLLVHGLPRGDVLASAALPGPYFEQRLRFLGPRRVRFYGTASSGPGDFTEVLDLVLPDHRLETRGRWPGNISVMEPLSPDGRHLLLSDRAGQKLRLVDVETPRATDLGFRPPGAGAPHPDSARRAPAAASPRPVAWGTFLADGRLALLIKHEEGNELRILRPDQPAAERRFSFPKKSVYLGGQPAPDRLLVATWPKEPWNRHQPVALQLLDLTTGTAHPVGRGLTPLWRAWKAGPTSATSNLFFKRGQGLIRLDLETGRETLVVPGEEATS